MDSSIIVAIISLVGSFITVYLSFIKDFFQHRYQIRREQLDKFYIPFYTHYCCGFFPENKLSTMSLAARSKFLDLLSHNLHLLKPKSQAMFPDFYLAYLNLLEAEDDNPDYPLEQCQQEFDKVFDKMSVMILHDYKGILRQCHLPVPSIKTI